MSIIIGGNTLAATDFNATGETGNNISFSTRGLILNYDAGNLNSLTTTSNYYDCGYGCGYGCCRCCGCGFGCGLVVVGFGLVVVVVGVWVWVGWVLVWFWYVLPSLDSTHPELFIL